MPGNYLQDLLSLSLSHSLTHKHTLLATSPAETKWLSSQAAQKKLIYCAAKLSYIYYRQITTIYT